MSRAAHRRRAARAALVPVLGEAALPDVLALLTAQAGTQEDGIGAVIAFIDAVAARHLLDAGTRKRLYTAYHEALARPDAELPADPAPETDLRRSAWDAEAVRGMAPPMPAPPTAAAPATTPPVASPSPAAPPAPEPPARSREEAAASEPPAETQVFAALMRAALQAAQQSHPAALEELRDSATAMLPRLRGGPRLREQLRSAWSQAGQADWLILGSAASLAEIVEQFYVALCETLGPVEADRLLTEAVREAGRVEAAKRFSPRRLV